MLDVSLGEFTDREFSDADFGFAFVGAVDWMRSGTDFVVPNPPPRDSSPLGS
jgi:hypothetical protein